MIVKYSFSFSNYLGNTILSIVFCLFTQGSQQLSGERRTYLENALNRGEQDLPIDQTEAVKSAAVYDRLNFEVD